MARGVNGGEPVGAVPARPIVSSTFSRTASRETPEGLERLGRDALTLVDQAQEDVLGADETVVEQPRLLLGQHQDSSSSVCESFEHSTASIRGQ